MILQVTMYPSHLPGGSHSLDAALLQPLAAPGDQTLHAGPISGALPTAVLVIVMYCVSQLSMLCHGWYPAKWYVSGV